MCAPEDLRARGLTSQKGGGLFNVGSRRLLTRSRVRERRTSMEVEGKKRVMSGDNGKSRMSGYLFSLVIKGRSL
jgi:hypothetical protein